MISPIIGYGVLIISPNLILFTFWKKCDQIGNSKTNRTKKAFNNFGAVENMNVRVLAVVEIMSAIVGLCKFGKKLFHP